MRKAPSVKEKILHMLEYAQRHPKRFPYGLTLRHIAGTTRMSKVEEHRASVAMAELVKQGMVRKTRVGRNGVQLERTHYALGKEDGNLWMPVLDETVKAPQAVKNMLTPLLLGKEAGIGKSKVLKELKSKQKRFVLSHEAMHAPHAPRLTPPKKRGEFHPPTMVTLTVTTDLQTARLILAMENILGFVGV